MNPDQSTARERGRRPSEPPTLPGRGSVRSVAVGVMVLLAGSTPAMAHGMPGGEASLAGIPPWLYLGSGAGVVVLSFAAVGRFARREVTPFAGGGRTLAVDLSALVPVARVLAVLLYAGVVALGLFGPASFRVNPTPSVLLEVGWWVSYGIFAIVVGDVWPTLNPWKTLFEWAGEPTLDRAYPAWLGTLPALLGFLAFAWLDVVVFAFGSPRFAGLFALGYGLVMVAGMGVFGTDDWLWHADAFTRVFDFFGRFAPLEPTDDGVTVRGYATGLVDDAVEDAEEVLLVIAMVFVLSFDGFTETGVYPAAIRALSPPGLPPGLSAAVVGGVLLLVGFVAFVGAYVLVAALAARLAGSTPELGAVMRRFVLTLVPIAVAYHVAHYSLYYLLQHELLVGVLLHPLPGAAVPADPDLLAGLSTTAVWYYTVGLIVAGHVVAVWVGHHASLSFFRTRRAAVRSQIPMTVLMVGYTVVSLWIVSQPFGG